MSDAQFSGSLFSTNAFLRHFDKTILVLMDSEPPLKITEFPDFKHNTAASIVTLGLDS